VRAVLVRSYPLLPCSLCDKLLTCILICPLRTVQDKYRRQKICPYWWGISYIL
jgi:hypothetical protein